MKVFASDLDGCIANPVAAIEKRLKEHFGLSEHTAARTEHYHFYERFDLPKEETEAFLHSADCWDNPGTWLEATAYKSNIEEMTKWVFEGWVPSIITARPPHMRLTSEIWMAQNDVPYSNFLLGSRHGEKGKLCYHVDASFMIEDQVAEAVGVAQSGIKCYVIKHPYNKHERNVQVLNDAGENLIQFVSNYQEIAELEKIGA